MNTKPFQKILEAVRIGDMLLRNRIVMAPMVDNFDGVDGRPTERKAKYFEARAKAGVGLVIVGSICIDARTGRMHQNQLLIDEDKFIPGLRMLAHAIQRHGAKVCAQIHHFGAFANPEITHHQNIAPSAVKVAGREAREMTVSEIEEIISRHIDGAVRAKKAGFDSVQIMMSAGYLLNSFLSGVTNRRRDAYGGDLRNRARICLEIVKGIKERLGKDFPISAKISPSEKGAEYGIQGCFTIEEGREFACMLEDAGISFLSIQSRGWIQTADGLGPNYYLSVPSEPGPFMADVEELRKGVRIPLMTTGRLNPLFAEQLLKEGKIDLVGIARGFLADPELVNKIASGTADCINPCINCLYCFKRILAGEPLRCAVNPAVGREGEYKINPAERRKKVLVVGGGPAGMEAARVSAERGHDVVLYERGGGLGGQLAAAARAPKKRDIEDLINTLELRMRRLGVKVELGTEATPKTVEREKPDVVVLAAGASPVVPELPGINRSHVVTAEDVLLNKVKVGQKVVIIGGGVVGCETADFLSDQGKTVIVVEMMGELAPGMSNIKKRQLMDRLNEKGVTLLIHTTCHGVTGDEVVGILQRGERKTLEADTVVLAAGSKPNTQLSQALEGEFSELYPIGDCVEPRKIAEAIDDGFRVGCLV